MMAELMEDSMQVYFLGTGDAFDNHLPNTSLLIRSEQGTILVDCGFTAAAAYWRQGWKAEDLDALYITHLHGDHYFGLPALLLRMHEDGRTRPLDVLTSPNRLATIQQVIEQAYAGYSTKLSYELRLSPLPLPGKGTWADVAITTAPTIHGVENYSVRFDFPDGKSVMVSGDGEITPASAPLFAGCDLVIHEAFRLTDHTPGHSSVREVLLTAAAASPPPARIALVHTSRTERHQLRDMDGDFLVPRPGSCISW
jgi:ribonuclease Z